jgi:hypothetical protein
MHRLAHSVTISSVGGSCIRSCVPGIGPARFLVNSSIEINSRVAVRRSKLFALALFSEGLPEDKQQLKLLAMDKRPALDIAAHRAQTMSDTPLSLGELVNRLLAHVVILGSSSAIVFRFDFDTSYLELGVQSGVNINSMISPQWMCWLESFCARVVTDGAVLRLESLFNCLPVRQQTIRVQAAQEASNLLSEIFRPWTLLHPEVSWEVCLSGHETLANSRHFTWSIPMNIQGAEPTWLLRMRQVLEEPSTMVQFSTHLIDAAIASESAPAHTTASEWFLAMSRGFSEQFWVFGWNGLPLTSCSVLGQLLAPIACHCDSLIGIAHLSMRQANTLASSYGGDPFQTAAMLKHEQLSPMVESLIIKLREICYSLGLPEALPGSASSERSRTARSAFGDHNPIRVWGTRRPASRRSELLDAVFSERAARPESPFALCETLGRPPAPWNQTGNCLSDFFPPDGNSTAAKTCLCPRPKTSVRTLECLQPGWESDLFGAKKDRAVPVLPEFQNVPRGIRSVSVTRELRAADLPHARIIGQFDRKFIVFQTSKGIFLLDQHAADERVRFEHLSKLYCASLERKDHTNAISRSVSLRVPVPVHLGSRCLSSSMSRLLQHLGWSWETSTTNSLQQGTMVLRSVPCILGQQPPVEAADLLEYIDLMLEAGQTMSIVPAAERVLATLACRHAIMFGDYLEPASCEALLKRLARCQLPFQCAHGRPSIAALACPTNTQPI